MPIASSRGELHARFFREALAQSGAKRHGGHTPLVPWKDAIWPVPAWVKIEVTCEVKVRSKSIRRFKALGPIDRKCKFSVLKLR